MTNFSPPAPSESAATAAIPVRLLSSVAVVGRDNEPIYLRGDLCDCNNTSINSSSTPTSSAGAAATRQEVQIAGDASSSVITDDEESEATTKIITGEGGSDEDGDSLPSNNSQGGNKGLFGRFKGAVGMNNNNNDADDATDEKEKEVQEHHEDDNGNDEDPFGFFENNNSNLQSSSNKNNNNNSTTIPAMSLTQQLVLHASLDRFEEMASRSNKGGAVRWRTPGSNSTNAMWMGLLCQVEERWNVYGYLTNTGIKFMILVENIYLNQDGSRFRQDHAPPSSSSLSGNTSLPSSPRSNGSSSREADLKNMFVSVIIFVYFVCVTVCFTICRTPTSHYTLLTG
mmetsp:Transcript_22130/g.48134  ORF Transcript_22130/g.48134 Transcript_22130/m.48134 type:complete len:341 (-) Transcript_22130:402-1424(-)